MRITGRDIMLRSMIIDNSNNNSSDNHDWDVIIIGAGAAGFAAYERLRAAGLRVCILEARDRVGGRVFSRRLSDGSRVELGAQWLAGSGQNRLERLVARHGLSAYENYARGKTVQFNQGLRRQTRGEAFPGGLLARLDALRLVLRIAWKARRLRHEFAKGADQRSLAEWIERVCWSADNRRFWLNLLEQAFCCDPYRVSEYEALHNLQAVGGFARLATADQFFFKEGLQTIFERQASEAGDALRLSSPVKAIEQTASGVCIQTSGESWRASRAVLCVPPQVAHHIPTTPDWPADRAAILAGFQPGSVVKCVGIYERPWWRSLGFSGRVASPDGDFDLLIDSGFAPDGSGILVALVAGSRADLLNSRSDLEKRQVFEAFVQCAFRTDDLDAKDAAQSETALCEFYSHNWSDDPFALGAYSSRRAIGGWAAGEDVLARPFGRLHFAGTETAREWRGYIEGALESGERAAREVLAQYSQ